MTRVLRPFPVIAGALCAIGVFALSNNITTAGRTGAVQAAVLTGSRRAAASKEPSLLERDPRLQQKVTLVRGSRATVASVLRTLSREIKVPLSADERLSPVGLVASLQNESVADVMDALAALFNATWDKTDRGAYLLRSPFFDIKAWLPKNAAQRAQFQGGLEFVDEAGKLPAQTRQQLGSEEPGNSGMRFSDLPLRMQGAIRRVVEAQMQREQVEGPTFPAINGGKETPLPVQPSNVAQSRVRFEQDAQANTTFYEIRLSNERGSLSIPFNNSEQLRSRNQARLASANTYKPQDGAGSEQAVAQDARLRQPVSLSLKQATLARAVKALADKAPTVSFLTFGHDEYYGVRDLSIARMPLKDALDRLTQQYPKSAWELRNSGMIVVRSR